MPHGLFLHAVAGGECYMSCVTGSPLDSGQKAPGFFLYISYYGAGLSAHIISWYKNLRMRAKRELGEFCLIKGSEFSTLLLSTSLTVGELTIGLPGLLGDNLAEFRAAVDFHV